MNDSESQLVFIVDDDAAVRDSIEELVESVGLRAKSYASAREFLDDFERQGHGCLVLDVRMAEMSGLELQRKLNDLDAAIPVIVLTGHGDIEMAVDAMRNGAVDFLQKPYREQALLDSINVALARVVSAGDGASGFDDLESRLANLTKRERQVLKEVVSGSTSKHIARKLDLSPRTVDAHRRNLLRKLGLRTTRELILHQTPGMKKD